MSNIPLVTHSAPEVHGVGVIAILTGIISAIGVVFLIAMFILFMTPYRELGMQAGMANDICVALQYMLTIPVALTLYSLLRTFNPALLRIATIVGIRHDPTDHLAPGRTGPQRSRRPRHCATSKRRVATNTLRYHSGVEVNTY